MARPPADDGACTLCGVVRVDCVRLPIGCGGLMVPLVVLRKTGVLDREASGDTVAGVPTVDVERLHCPLLHAGQ